MKPSQVKTSLGIWAFGSMATRLVPGGYQPQWANEPTVARVRRAVEGLGDLIDGYEFHYPQELSTENLGAVQDALEGHDVYCVATGLRLDPALRQGRPRLAGRGDATRGAQANARGDRLRGRARRPLHHLAGDRGLQLPVPHAVPRVVGLVRGRARRGGAARAPARRDDLPRAQELRAGDEDPDAQRRHDAARHPQAAHAGPRQGQGQHGLAAT